MSYGSDGPQGLQPHSYLGGSTWNQQQREYTLRNAYSTSLFYGDPVYFSNDGNIVIAGTGDGNPISGVFVGVKYTDANNTFVTQDYWLANTPTLQNLQPAVYILDDPNVIYSIQVKGNPNGGDPNIITAANLTKNINLNAGAGGSTRTQQSGFFADLSTLGPGANKQLKILGMAPAVNSTVGTAFANILVIINNNPLRSGGTGSSAPT